jgi:ATP-dependent Zn protease
MESTPKKGGAKRPSSKQTGKNIGFFALIALFIVIGISALNQPGSLKDIPITQVVQEANAGKYDEVQVHGQQLSIIKKGDKQPTLRSTMEEGATTNDEGIKKDKVKIVVKPSSSTTSNVISFGLTTIVPVLLIGTGRFGQDVLAGATEGYTSKAAELAAVRMQIAAQRQAPVAITVAKKRRVAA